VHQLQLKTENKPNGFLKKCRDCEATIYLHRGGAGPWRAFEPAEGVGAEEWNRHRCAAGLADAEMMTIVAPPGTKPDQIIPRVKRLIEDFRELLAQAEQRQAELQAQNNS
jgi:sugar phosphate isomerase/epimerase